MRKTFQRNSDGSVGSDRSVRSILAVLAFLCSYTSLDAATLEKVRIGYSVGGLIPFPLIVAKENRFFEQAGLDVELINIPPTIAVTALVSGDIQYVIFAGTTLNAAVRGLPVKLVMVYNDRPLFSLMSKAEIRSIKELKGKVLGVATLTSGESFMSRRLLKDAGIDADKEMILRVIGNTPDRLQALRAGSVDATTLTTPVDIIAERMGLRRLAFMGDTLESINGGFGVSDRWLQQRPDQVRKMIAVAFRGMSHARAQRQDSIALIMSKWKLERDVAEKAFDSTINTWAENGIASDQALQAGIEESLKVSNSKQTVPLSRVADFTLAREVYREIKAK
ncbi:MAG: ABC transporter substrate-binding protein [Deltaproteobacteria bacterium]|nr:ABC transporter substrate-binding protein [Deltaproteobacteria bacterium]